MSSQFRTLGIIAGLAGSIAINTGNNIQSLGMVQLEEEAKAKAKKDGGDVGKIDNCKSKVWVIGTVIFVTGSLLNFASYALAEQSLLASLEAVQFVSNCLFGKFIMGKTITYQMWGGTALIICGVVMTVSFSSQKAEELTTIWDVRMLWSNPVWLSYVALMIIAGVALHLLYQVFERNRLRHERGEEQLIARSHIIRPVIYATWSAIFGTMSVVFIKVVAWLLLANRSCQSARKQCPNDDIACLKTCGINIWAGEDWWFLYTTLLSWLCLMLVWLYRLNEALSLYDPIFIIPLLQSNFILFAIISGGIFFKEFDYMTCGHSRLTCWIGFVGGMVLIFIGVTCLAPSCANKEQEEEQEANGELIENGVHSKHDESRSPDRSRTSTPDRSRTSTPERLERMESIAAVKETGVQVATAAKDLLKTSFMSGNLSAGSALTAYDMNRKRARRKFIDPDVLREQIEELSMNGSFNKIIPVMNGENWQGYSDTDSDGTGSVNGDEEAPPKDPPPDEDPSEQTIQSSHFNLLPPVIPTPAGGEHKSA